MKKTIIICLLCLFAAMQTYAQRINHRFDNVSMAEALRSLNKMQKDYTVNFIYDDLEDFRVTTTVKGKRAPEAILQIIGFYPIRQTIDGKSIFVECTHKTAKHYEGRLIDENGQPVEYANVALLSPRDSSLIGGGVSTESGVFVIPSDANRAILRVSCVGFTTIFRNTEIGNVGTIRMQTNAIKLKAVAVKGYRPSYKMTSGGMTIDVEHSLLSDVGNAVDVLKELPRVSVSNDNAVSVFGKGTPLIYINNRKIDNAEDLQQLLSSDIKSVDVITSPGSMYDAEVQSVIRIKTKNNEDGLSFTSNARGSYNGQAHGSQSNFIKYHNNGLELFANTYIWSWTLHHDNNIGQNIYGKDVIEIIQEAGEKGHGGNVAIDLGASYDFNDHHSVGVKYEPDKSLYDRTKSLNMPQTIMRNGTEEGKIISDADIKSSNGLNHKLSAYYIGEIGKLGVDLNATYYNYRSTDDRLTNERSTTLQNRDVHIYSESKDKLYAAKLIISYPVWKGDIRCGAELTNSSVDHDYKNQECYVPSSLTEIKESNTAGFADYSVTSGNWSFNMGVRYEDVTADCFIDGVRQDNSKHYSDWFPNASIAYNAKLWSWQLSYVSKTKRPNYNYMRGNTQYDNRYMVEGGNPMLSPMRLHSLEGMLAYRWLNLSIGYTSMNNYFTYVLKRYNDSGVLMFRPENIKNVKKSYVSVVVSPNIGFFRPQYELNLEQSHYDISGYSFAYGHSPLTFSASLYNRFVINNTFNISVNASFTSRSGDLFRREKATGTIGFRVTKTFFDKQLSATLYADDLLRTSKEQWTQFGENSDIWKDCYSYSRCIGFSLIYNFRTTKSRYKGTGAGQSEINRM